MLDMVAFLGARAGTVALQNLAGLPDSHITVQGNNVFVPAQCSKILALTALSQATAGSLTNQVRLTSPSLGSTSNIDLVNWNANGAVVAAAQIPDNNCPMADFKESPVDLQPGEGLQALTAVDVASVAENVIIPIVLTDGALINPLKGRIETIIFDGQAAAVANAWTPSALVPRQALRAGTYAVVGMKSVGTTQVAARLIFGNQGARPGVISTNAAVGAAGVGSFSDAVDQYQGLFRYGRLGVWGTFSHLNPPQSEILCSAADAAITQHVALDLMKIA
jgi:hypothetical protein